MGYLARFDPFWDYLAARNAITVRRLRGDPWPWTDDPVLLRFRFPNVYRELDRGTIYLRELLDRTPEVDRLLTLMTYRHFNRIDTAEVIFPLRLDELESQLRTLGHFPYTQAYRTSVNIHLGSHDQIRNSLVAVKHWQEHLSELQAFLKAGPLITEAFDCFSRLPGVGPFLGYLLVCEVLLLGVSSYSENSGTFPHTGSLACLSELLAQPIDKAGAVLMIRRLQDEHELELAQRGFEFIHGPLTLRHLEDGLCEYGKYVRLGRGEKLGARHYPQPLVPTSRHRMLPKATLRWLVDP